MNRLFITPHALQRARDHCADIRHLSDEQLIRMMKKRIHRSLDDEKKVQAPGGTYVPISLQGQDGFAVLHKLQVVTFLPEEWCEEIMQHGDFF
jgi:hypothetical protein